MALESLCARALLCHYKVEDDFERERWLRGLRGTANE